MPKKVTKSQLAKEMIEEFTKDGKCTLSKKKLGELLHYRYPSEFKNDDSARSAVRNITNAKGDPARKAVGLRVEWNGFNLPEQEKNDYSRVILSEKRIGILSDIHFPYADLNALNTAVRYLLDWKPDCIILNGDTIDMYHGSDFEQDPRNRNPKYEFDVVREFLIQLNKLFPNTRIIYKAGNHCERYEKKIMQRVPQFIDLEWMTLDFALNHNMPFKVEVIKNKRLIRAGHLNIGHGHELSKGFIAPVNVARGFYMKTKANFIGGHHHRTSEHIEQDINGKVAGAWSTGCLCELNPKYMPINAWNHGFATVEIDGDEFSVKNLKINKGKVV
jgi:predicted phosphodiesterase